MKCSLILLCLLSSHVSAQQQRLVFTNVSVIDATGVPPKPDMTVVIADGLQQQDQRGRRKRSTDRATNN